VDAFFYGVVVLDFEPFIEKIIVHLGLNSDAFEAFFRRLCFPLSIIVNRTYIYLRFKKVSPDLPLIIY
jgi:hypothetical protein